MRFLSFFYFMNYPQYRKLSATQKAKRISQAKSKQEDRRPHPLNNQQFPEQDFINFQVTQKGKQIKLHTYRHQSKQQPKAVVFMFHGLNAHIGQGAHIARLFAEKGFTTVGFDHRGFGKSEGQKGYIQSLDQHLQDSLLFIKIMMKIMKEKYEKQPKYFGYGLSMGGMTVYYLALRNPKLFDSVILMAPALMHNLPSFVPSITNFIANILPNSTRLLPPMADKSNRNPNVTEYRKKDPYCFNDRAYLSTMNFIVSVMSQSEATFKEFSCPFMIVQGGLDKLVNPEVAFKLYDEANVKSSQKRLLFYENMWHGIWHEDEVWQITKECVDWFNERININVS